MAKLLTLKTIPPLCYLTTWIFIWAFLASAQGQTELGGRPAPDPHSFVEHAMRFDQNADGKLSRQELRVFANEFARQSAALGEYTGDDQTESKLVATNLIATHEKDGFRYIDSNGIPDHVPGQFPNRGNPNRISAQRYQFRVPLNPEMADHSTDARGVLFGIALNGVPFDPGTAEVWHNNPNWRYDALSGKINLGLDESNAHVQPTGAYHYHGLPTGLISKLGESDQITLVGYAADGFPIYNQIGYKDANDSESSLVGLRSSYQLRKGQRPEGDEGPGGTYDGTFDQDFEFVAGSGDLDECNGRFAITPEYPTGVYQYVITEQFPFISRRFKGIPDDSFRRRGPRSPSPASPVGPHSDRK